jgi:tRNA (guanine37-N1)-methyltransferase
MMQALPDDNHRTVQRNEEDGAAPSPTSPLHPTRSPPNSAVAEATPPLSLDYFPDLSVFVQQQDHLAISVPTQQTAQYRKWLKDWILTGHKNVFPDTADTEEEYMEKVKETEDGTNKLHNSNSSRRVIVLKREATREQIQEALFLRSNNEEKAHPTQLSWQFRAFPVIAKYKDWTTEAVLRKILPNSIKEIPSSFELVGTIAHVNLRDECLVYKYWIGRVLMDKNPAIRTVVNKIGTIHKTFRTFGMELIGGNDKPGWSITTVSEHGCRFQLDYQHVYWNSRLSGEHKRLVDCIRKDDDDIDKNKQQIVVADCMAGVGPFAVPLTCQQGGDRNNLGQRRITVHANDLNPASYQYLCANQKLNKCTNLHVYNQDARDFVWNLPNEIDHAILNLPASAPEFLDAFRGWQSSTFPLVHVHCFASKPTIDRPYPERDAVQRCEKALGCPIDNDPQIHVVRDVSPGKNMLCVSFRLPKQVKHLPRSVSTAEGQKQNDSKRQKINRE